MPRTAQDRIGRGPFAALLILLGLLLGSGTAAAAAAEDIRQSARPSPSRQPASAALLPPGTRNALQDEASPSDRDGPPPEPGIVTARLQARPAAAFPFGHQAGLPSPSGPSHRARAPPAA